MEHEEDLTPHVIDKTGWPDGPWMTEPDKRNWITKAGLDGMIVRNRLGALCGYVAVPNGHPLYGADYNHIDGLRAHGGLTYTDKCADHICHVPEPGRPSDVWWLGFDTAHAFDLIPGMMDIYKEVDRKNPGLAKLRKDSVYADVYKDMGYVTAEVESLAAQVVAGLATVDTTSCPSSLEIGERMKDGTWMAEAKEIMAQAFEETGVLNHDTVPALVS